MNVPGSPSSMLTAISRGAGSARTIFHLRPVGESGAAQAAQRRALELRDHRVDAAFAGDASGERAVAAAGPISGEIDAFDRRGFDVARADRGFDRRRRGAVDRVAADDGGRRVLAAADAWRADDADVGALEMRERVAQRLCAGHRARQRLAHAHGDGRRRGFAFLHDIEVVIERGDLVHLGHRETHLLRQRGQVRGRQEAEARPGCGADAR